MPRTSFRRIQAFRLIVRSGPRFIGVYLVFAAIAATMHSWLFDGVQYLIGPRSFAVTIAYHPTLSAAVDLIATTLSVALYAAAFDRCLASAIGLTPLPVGPGSTAPRSKPFTRGDLHPTAACHAGLVSKYQCTSWLVPGTVRSSASPKHECS